MSLVRFLPTPSDRMGVIWSLLSIGESIVLEYGPAGTTHYSMGLYGGLGIRFYGRLFTTHLSEDDVVMGDVTRLEESILELDKNYHPKVIFVVASSTTAVIGTDIKGVCRYMQKETQAKLITFEQGGFRGDYSAGTASAYARLVQQLPRRDVEKRSGVYNIIGASMWQYRMTSDIWEVEQLLREAFGLEKNACLCCETSVEEIETMGAAEVNIVLSSEGLEAARTLQETFGTPFIYAVPYGYEGTVRFLEQVGEILGKKPNPVTLMRIRMKEKGMSMLGMFAMMGGGKVVPRAFIKGDYERVKGIGAFLEQAGVTVEHKLCDHAVKTVPEPDPSVIHYPEEKDWLKLTRPLQHTLVLADDVALSQCDATNTKVRLSAPFLKGSQVATHLPFMGEKGADFLLEAVQEYYQSF